MTEPDPVKTLRLAAADLTELGIRFAVVGGLAVSVRSEVRFTRDVDLAIDVADDARVEALVRDLRPRGYEVIALVEHDEAKRLATVRLRSASGVTVDLLAASSGIEAEIVKRATPLTIEGIGTVSVAEPEELLAMKVLSMTDRRLQDRLDALRLISHNPAIDLQRVQNNLRVIEQRGYARRQDLRVKLEMLLASPRD
jgi:predicted nucleotidyltransferase